MKYDFEMGIPINEEVKGFINEAANLNGSVNSLAKSVGISQQIINNWQGNATRKGKYITWKVWVPLRDYLIAHGIIDDELRWKIPSELRQIAEDAGKLPPDEARILSLYRLLDDTAKGNITAMMEGLVSSFNKAASTSRSS